MSQRSVSFNQVLSTYNFRNSDATTLIEYDTKESRGSRYRTMSVVEKRTYFMDDF